MFVDIGIYVAVCKSCRTDNSTEGIVGKVYKIIYLLVRSDAKLIEHCDC